MPRTDIEPITLNPDDHPWQQMPEMAESYAAERAGIEAGLRLVEVVHSHYSERLFNRRRIPARIARMNAALAITRLRVDIVGVMQ